MRETYLRRRIDSYAQSILISDGLVRGRLHPDRKHRIGPQQVVQEPVWTVRRDRSFAVASVEGGRV
jgi:hypothetical protein